MLVKGIINCFFLILFISQCICINIKYFILSLFVCIYLLFVHLSVIFLLMVTKKQTEILLNGFLFRCLLLKGCGKGLKVTFHNNLLPLLVKENFIFPLLIRILFWFISELIPLSQCNILLPTPLTQLTGDFFIILLDAIISIFF